jgi:hypothetical protein
MLSYGHAPRPLAEVLRRRLWRAPGGRRFAATAAACGLMMTGVTVAAAPSASADPQVAISPGQDNCVDYSQGKIWHASNAWARVRYRPCLVESGDGSMVQSVIQVQFDWPFPANCSLSVGFPPFASVGCGLSSLAVLDEQITFRTYTSYNSQPVDFEIPLEFTQPDGETFSGWCYYNPTNNSNNTTTFDGLLDPDPVDNTFSCTGPVVPRQTGTYTVGSLGPRGDVKNDGADARILTAGQMQFVSQ